MRVSGELSAYSSDISRRGGGWRMEITTDQRRIWTGNKGY